MKQKIYQIQQAVQQTINWNQVEHQRAVDMRLQGIDYIPEYKSYKDFLEKDI